MNILSKEFGQTAVYRGSIRNQVYRINTHIHQFCEVIFVFDGELRLTLEGESFILKKGDLAVVTPFRSHAVHSLGCASFWICVFSNSCVPDFESEVKFFYNRTLPHFSPSEALKAQISDMLSHTEHPAQLEGAEISKRIKAVLYSIFAEYTEAVTEVASIANAAVLSSFMLYVNDHYLEKISLKEVAKALGYNPKYLSQCLSDIPNTSFPSLVNSLRTDHAKKLLTSTDFKIIDVAYECGYENEQTFHRTFRKITGMTPGSYRKLSYAKKNSLKTQKKTAQKA